MKLSSVALILVGCLTVRIPSAAADAPGAGHLPSAEEEQRLQEMYPAYRGVDPDYRHASEAAIERWKDYKWGLRIHFGLYSTYNTAASWILVRPQKDRAWQMNYYTAYQRFNPSKFDADQWMEIMQRGGMRYFAFTTKHHEGFCMWPTKTLQRGFRKNADGGYDEVVNHFSIAETPYGKDIVGQLVRSARTHNLGVSLYYSHVDWHDWDFGWDPHNFWYDGQFTKKADDPKRWAAFIQKERDQITELLTSYGPIDTLCLDINWPKEAQRDCEDVARLARRLQPDIMLRNRGIGPYGDYETPEGEIPENPNEVKRPWQLIYRCGWGDSPYKPREWVLETLIDIVAKGGNFQAGYNPDESGAWPQKMIDAVTYVGDWLRVNGESIFATRPYLRYHEGTDLRFTRTKDRKYVYILTLQWPGATLTSKLVHAKPGSRIRMLGYDCDLVWEQNGRGLTIHLPPELQTEANRPCRQAWAFKVESEDWEKFAASLPSEAPAKPAAGRQKQADEPKI